MMIELGKQRKTIYAELLSAEDAIDGLNALWFALRDELKVQRDEFNSVIAALHETRGDGCDD